MTTATVDTGARRRSLPLGEAATEFARHGSPWLVAAFLVTAVVARATVGGVTTTDLWIVVATLAAQPLVEWVVHQAVLHWRPRQWRGRTIDPLVARRHRAHHEAPRDVDLVFIPLPVLAWLIPLEIGVALLVAPRASLAWTYLVTIGVVGLVYEWTHYLIHTDYRPKGRLYRRLWQHHRLHHFKNENYWWTVTSTFADRALGTAPDPAEVPSSPTARRLHAEA